MAPPPHLRAAAGLNKASIAFHPRERADYESVWEFSVARNWFNIRTVSSSAQEVQKLSTLGYSQLGWLLIKNVQQDEGQAARSAVITQHYPAHV